MPSRPRQHQLADESRKAFEAVLPKAWVFRPENPDYGIDGEVEVFDDNGNTTGHRFYVQLKGTDAADEASAKSVVLRRVTGDYYASLELPVLIVSYNAPGGTLYARWFHEFDPYYGGLGEQSIRFAFRDRDRWTRETPNRLLRDLTWRRQVRTGDFQRPIPLFVSVGVDLVAGLRVQSVKNALARALGSLSDTVILSDSAENALVVIELAETQFAVTIGSEISVTLHAREPHTDPQVLAHDILIGLAMAFGKAKQSGITAQIASLAADKASIIHHPEAFSRIAMQLAEGGRVVEALALSERLAVRFGPVWAAEALRMPALAARRQLSSAETGFYEGYLKRRISLAEQSGDLQQVAVGHYNLGNFLRGTGRRREAIQEYTGAVRADPSYWQREYFSRELAGLLFELHRFKCAVRLYQLSLEKGAGQEVRPLLADALMFAGEYEKALLLFREHFKASGDTTAEWRLKEWALSNIVEGMGVTAQTRNTKRAEALSGDLERVKRESDALLEEAFRADAISGLAWFNKGASCLERGDECEAALSLSTPG